jgi:NTE family protein
VKRKRKIGLALGSGAARGLSQIGLLLYLKEKGIEIDVVSGTSIGSIIGAAISYGYTPEYLRDLALSINWIDILRYLRPSLKGTSLLEWKKIDGFMREMFGEKSIEELKIPYGCVATDIDTGNEYVFRKGRVTEALRASACIPAIFPAVEMNGIHLVDGALVTPVPINLAFELGADAVIGVNVNLSIFTERMTFDDVPASRQDRYGGKIKDLIEKNPLVQRGLIDTKGLEERYEKHRRKRNLMDVVTDTAAITASRILSLELLETTGPLFLVRPEVGGYQDFDFDMARDIMDHGYRAAEDAGEELLEFCR